MSGRKSTCRVKSAALFLALATLGPIMTACSGGKPVEMPTTTFTLDTAVTSTPAAVGTTTPTPTASEPVKIGAITSWSGPVAMAGFLADQVIKVVEKQIKDTGGILGGREVRFVKYDNASSVAEAVGGARKLFYDDKVSALVFGGTTGTEIAAVADAAEELKILFVAFGYGPWLASKKYTVSPGIGREEIVQQWFSLTSKVLKAETVAFLAADLSDNRIRVETTRQRLEAAGIKTVFEQYTPADTTDYMSYLTKLKFVNPDVIILENTSPEFNITIAKQITELGGLSDAKVLALSGAESAVNLAGADGWYILLPWLTSLDYPGAMKFRNDFKAVHGRLPTATDVYFYNCLWTAIYAIELAGTDTDLASIAQAARSGKLEWETPMGRAHFTAEGSAGLQFTVAHVEGGKLFPVAISE